MFDAPVFNRIMQTEVIKDSPIKAYLRQTVSSKAKSRETSQTHKRSSPAKTIKKEQSPIRVTRKESPTKAKMT
jgi:hypothetical protein